MSVGEQDHLPERIDTALRSEPTHSAPLSLHARIRARLVVLAAIERERRQLTTVSIVAALVLLFSVATGTGLFLFPQHGEAFLSDMPGALGLYDYVQTRLPVSPMRGLGVTAVLLSLPLGAMLVQTVWPRPLR